MGFNQEFLCKRLCEANRSIIVAWAMAREWKRIEEYLFRCGEGCYITYDGKTGTLWDAEFDVYDQEGMTVSVETIGRNICGHVDGKEIYSCELPEEVAEELFLLAGNRWKEERRYMNLEEEGTVTRELLAGPR